jgi:AraC-like DNA-binding protein
MFLQFFEPQPALKEIVNNIMINQVDFDPLQPKPSFPFPPLPEHCLFFYPYDCMEVEHIGRNEKQKQASSIVVGPQTERLTITMGHHHLVIKVGFQPGGLYRLLGIPMQELLRTEAFDAMEFFGNEVADVNDQLRAAAAFTEMKMIVEHYLLKKIKKVKQRLPIDFILPLIIKEGGLINIDYLANTACLSNRQFERVFKDRIGLSPKFFSRLVRFANAWVAKESTPTLSWIKIAHQCGYYDQMHLIRDFKEFTGINPSEIEAAMHKNAINLNTKVFF